jgi:hypothetical protein
MEGMVFFAYSNVKTDRHVSDQTAVNILKDRSFRGIRLMIGLFFLSCLFCPVFAEIPPLTITSVSPTAGWASSLAKDDGTWVKISGTGFDAAVIDQVLFSGTSGGTVPVPKSSIIVKSEGAFFETDKIIGATGTGQGQFLKAWDVAVDRATGEIYVVDTSNHKVEVFTKSGVWLRDFEMSERGVNLLENPYGIALDSKDGAYVSRREAMSYTQGLVRFFKDGTFEYRFESDRNCKDPQDIEVDSKGDVYYIDAGKMVVKKITPAKKINTDPDVRFTITGPSTKPFQGLRSISIDEKNNRLYVLDSIADTIYVYDLAGTFQETWDKDTKKINLPHDFHPTYSSVDDGGSLYVQSSATVMKISPSGESVSLLQFDNLEILPGELRTIDADNGIYAVDSTYHSVRRYRPIVHNEEIWVRVPAGAKTGPITVKRTTPGSEASSGEFTVLEVSPKVSIDKVEITQGIWSYPFVAGKETLVWAKISGIFGDPARDKAILSFTDPYGVKRYLDADHITYNWNDKTSIIHFHVPVWHIQDSGTYNFAIDLKRDGHALVVPGWDNSKVFTGKKGLSLVLVKFTNVRESEWTSGDPFPWYDDYTFLYSIETLKRVFPIDAQGVRYYFGSSKYIDYTGDGISKDEQTQLSVEMRKVFNEAYINTKSDHAVGFLYIPRSSEPTAGGWADPKHWDVIVGFYKRSDNLGTTGAILSHELAHNYDVIAQDAYNYADNPNKYHSKNDDLSKEDGQPIYPWNPITDDLGKNPHFMPVSLMGLGVSPSDDEMFLESLNDGHKLEYYTIFDRRKSTSSALLASITSTGSDLNIPATVTQAETVRVNQPRPAKAEIPLTADATSDFSVVFLKRLNDGNKLDYNAIFNKLKLRFTAKQQSINPADSNLVLAMTITPAGNVTVDQSFVTAAKIPLTAETSSDFSVVFLDAAGQRISSYTYPLLYGLTDAPEVEDAPVNLVIPYPSSTKSVEIRFGSKILATLKPSPNAPVVGDITVIPRGSAFAEVHWTGQDPDGEDLSYSILYSADNGRDYTLLLAGMQGTKAICDLGSMPGSSNARIKVIASDGFNRGEAISKPFQRALQTPVAAILQPVNRTVYTEGSVITASGSAADDEDGVLPADRIRWQLDNTHDLGTGYRRWFSEVPVEAPFGTVMMPPAVGSHTLTMTAVDSDGMETNATATFEILADSDRDGVSDITETSSGSDRYNPESQPAAPPGAITGTVFEDLNENGVKDTGDPGIDGVSVTAVQSSGEMIRTLTAGNGQFLMSGVPDGSYTVTVPHAWGFARTLPLSNAGTYTTTISRGSTASGLDFGIFRLGILKGEKWDDTNGNGQQELTEEGSEGGEITLAGTDMFTGKNISWTKTTNLYGQYTFYGLNRGTYTITEKAREGWTQTAPKSTSYTVSIDISGTVVSDQDFGDIKSGNERGKL